MIKAKLIVVGGDAKRTEVALKQLPATIGRAREASITLPHSLVSRKHCEIYEEHDQLFVRDLNSLNGTYLNNEKIDGSKALKPGQLLTLGNVTFRADYYVETEALAIRSEGGRELDATSEFQDQDTIDVGMIPQVSQEKEDTAEVPGSVPTVQDDQFVFDGIEQPDKASISLGAIQELPPATPEVSFNGSINAESISQPIDPNTVEIDVGEEQNDQNRPTNSALNDFFRKMPK